MNRRKTDTLRFTTLHEGTRLETRCFFFFFFFFFFLNKRSKPVSVWCHVLQGEKSVDSCFPFTYGSHLDRKNHYPTSCYTTCGTAKMPISHLWPEAWCLLEQVPTLPGKFAQSCFCEKKVLQKLLLRLLLYLELYVDFCVVTRRTANPGS